MTDKILKCICGESIILCCPACGDVTNEIKRLRERECECPHASSDIHDVFCSKKQEPSEVDKIENIIRKSDACHCILRYCENDTTLPYNKSNDIIKSLAISLATPKIRVPEKIKVDGISSHNIYNDNGKVGEIKVPSKNLKAIYWNACIDELYRLNPQLKLKEE